LVVIYSYTSDARTRERQIWLHSLPRTRTALSDVHTLILCAGYKMQENGRIYSFIA